MPKLYSPLSMAMWGQQSCSRCRLGPLSRTRISASHRTAHLSSGPSREHIMQQYLEQARTRLHAVLRLLRAHSDKLSSNIVVRVDRFGTQINHVTGYEDIDKLKSLVHEKEEQLKTARETARSLKNAYDQAVSLRASAQRSVNSLLERKDRWSDADVSEFTSLIRSDHASNNAVSQTSLQLDAAEANVDRLFSELTKSILTRYHEEQIWSDKIRSFSTYANLIGLAVNLVVFVGAIAFVEPWKRRKLAEGLESRMAEMMGNVQAQIGMLTDETRRSGTLQSFNVDDQLPVRPVVTPQPIEAAPVNAENTPNAAMGQGASAVQARLQGIFGKYYPSLDVSSEAIQSSCLIGLSGIALGVALTSVLHWSR